MELQAIRKILSKSGAESSLEKLMVQELQKELKILVKRHVLEKVISRMVPNLPEMTVKNGMDCIPLSMPSQTAAARLPGKLLALKWIKIHSKKITPQSGFIVFGINLEAYASQMLKLDEGKRSIMARAADKALFLVDIFIKKPATRPSRPSSSAKDKAKTPQRQTQPVRNVLGPGAFTIEDFDIKKGVRYTAAKLNSLVQKGLMKHPNAIELTATIMHLAKLKSKRKVHVKSTLSMRDLMTVQKNILVIAAAVSALTVNPKLIVVFVDEGFVLFLDRRPAGRFGRELNESTLRALFKICREECGTIPGNKQAILDVLDAEGKKKDKQLKELFNDFSKHIITNSSGPAARAALKLKNVTKVQGKFDWTSFKKAFDVAATHVKEIDYDPMVDQMEKAVKEIHRGRNVLNIYSMDWMNTFLKKKLDWLGALTADILEDEVNSKAKAREALSCVANWKENLVDCQLSIKHLGTVGEEVVFVPCRKFKIEKWKIELQDIMKSGSRWIKR